MCWLRGTNGRGTVNIELKVEGRRRRGRPRLRWEDCVNRFGGLGGEWRTESRRQ